MLLKIIKIYLPYIIIGILCLFLLNQCEKNEVEKRRNIRNYTFLQQMYESNESTLRRDTTKKGKELVIQKQLVVTEREAKNMALIENERLKKIKSRVKVVTITKIKRIYIPFDSIIEVRIDTSTGDTIKNVAKVFRVNNEWYGINGRILENGVLIDSIYMNNRITATLGYEKQKGILKKKIPVLEIENANPFSRVNEVYNFVIEQEEKKFFQTTAFKMLVGGTAAIYLESKLRH